MRESTANEVAGSMAVGPTGSHAVESVEGQKDGRVCSCQFGASRYQLQKFVLDYHTHCTARPERCHDLGTVFSVWPMESLCF